MRRRAHFTRGMTFGSREFVEEWFETNPDFIAGQSRSGRKRGLPQSGEGGLAGTPFLACAAVLGCG